MVKYDLGNKINAPVLYTTLAFLTKNQFLIHTYVATTSEKNLVIFFGSLTQRFTCGRNSNNWASRV